MDPREQENRQPAQPMPDENSPIESLQQALDTPTVDVSRSFERPGFHSETHDVPLDWQDAPAKDQEPLMSRIKVTPKHHTIAKWLFVAAAAFFVVAFGMALFFLTGNRNVLTADKIDITITGPSTVSAGEVVPLAIEIKNNNASTLEVADLLVEYPRGTRSAEDVTVELLRTRVGLGDLSPGSRTATTTKAIVFGEEGTKQEIVVSLEYRVAGSNAIFIKERAFTVEIDDSPVALSVEGPASVNSGDEVRLELTVRSNSNAPVENVVVDAEYPFGFAFTSSSPDPSFGERVWTIGDIEPGGERTVVLRGKIEGQNDEERIFRFDLGVEGENGDVTDFETTFARAEHAVRIARPFIDLGLALEGESGPAFSVAAGSDVNLDISWKNNISGKLADAVVELKIDGTVFDERSVSAGTGYYDSSRNTVTWDKRSFSELALLEAGDTGRANVSFATARPSELAGSAVNPEIRLTLSFRGFPVGESGIPEQVRTMTEGTIRVETKASLASTIRHSSGPFENSGPIPPEAETETTYTVTWELSSLVNDVTNAVVTSSLPPYVTWENVIVPTDEDITYDESTGAIRWAVGTVRAGDGYSNPARAVSFQIGLTPSANQVGTSPTLINAATFKGSDGFTGGTISSTLKAETTTDVRDPGFRSSDGRVRE